MKTVRQLIGRLIILFDGLFPPQIRQRGSAEQSAVNEGARSLSLYQFEACPFCLKVRRAAKRLNIPLNTRDVLKNKTYEEELMKGGGTYQTPCLRIEEKSGETRWLYESSDIIKYLETRFP